MNKLKSPVYVETAFGSYTLTELIGEGGAGRVFGGQSSDGMAIAVKILSSERVSRDKKARFKKEIAFLSRNTHPNIVTVTDFGVATNSGFAGSFYVMKRYDTNLRDIMSAKIPTLKVLDFFLKILDGVEAAHLRGAVHRDLKPENVLCDAKALAPVIADFGIASFTEDLLVTSMETAPTQRLANFQYAAPEQRIPGQQTTATADIYALGLILNEMFTGAIPLGTEFRTISQVDGAYTYLDQIVAQMLRQNPSERPQSIAVVKNLIQRYHSEQISHQRLNELTREVVQVGEIDEPLASEPPRIVGVHWESGNLTIRLDKPVSNDWIQALRNMGNYSSVYNRGPETFRFNGNEAFVQAGDEREAQNIINHFKNWLPQATRMLKFALEQQAAKAAKDREAALKRAREQEEQFLRINRNLKF